MREVRAWFRADVARPVGAEPVRLYVLPSACAPRSAAPRGSSISTCRGPISSGARANYALNDLAVDPRDFIYGDAFDWLGRFARRAHALRPGRSSIRRASARRRFRSRAITLDWSSAAARVVARAGILVAATNHAGTSDERFEAWLRAGLETAGRHGRLCSAGTNQQRTSRWRPANSPTSRCEHSFSTSSNPLGRMLELGPFILPAPVYSLFARSFIEHNDTTEPEMCRPART